MAQATTSTMTENPLGSNGSSYVTNFDTSLTNEQVVNRAFGGVGLTALAALVSWFTGNLSVSVLNILLQRFGLTTPGSGNLWSIEFYPDDAGKLWSPEPPTGIYGSSAKYTVFVEHSNGKIFKRVYTLRKVTRSNYADATELLGYGALAPYMKAARFIPISMGFWDLQSEAAYNISGASSAPPLDTSSLDYTPKDESPFGAPKKEEGGGVFVSLFGAGLALFGLVRGNVLLIGTGAAIGIGGVMMGEEKDKGIDAKTKQKLKDAREGKITARGA